MALFARSESDNQEFQEFIAHVQAIAEAVSGHAQQAETEGLKRLAANFKMKTEDFYRENRKLNIGIVGQVKAGKSSFLNTLLFDGQDILPKASTPKTATLTKMEYADENVMQIEYYSPEEWAVLEENAAADLEEDIYIAAREIVEMVRKNGIDPRPYLEKGKDSIRFDSYETLLHGLNDYVGEDGRFTPIVKAVTLYLQKEEFQGISIVDTPGLNDPIPSRTTRTREFIEVCDVVFFLSQSGSFLDKSDWTLLSSQLPQKGVKKLVLIASKYDSGVRDILRAKEEDDIFGDDENTADNIPQACEIIRKKLRKRARSKVQEFVEELQQRESSPELIAVIRECAEPVLVSALAYNMAGKAAEQYSAEEKNVYAALKQFSGDMASDLRLLGNFDAVKALFAEVVAKKERILQEKARSLLPNAREELRAMLASYQEKAGKRIQILEGNDREQLLEQKSLLEKQMNGIRADITSLFGEINARLETEKAQGIRELREAGKDYLEIKEHSGSKTYRTSRQVSDSKWYKPWTWGKSHTEESTRTEHYSYCLAADAIENLKKYALEATNQVEKVFADTLQLRELKRRLLDVVLHHFDMGSEKYDFSIFKIMVEETVSQVEFPVFSLDISEAMGAIAGEFSGEITSPEKKTELSAALSRAISKILDRLCTELDGKVKAFKGGMNESAQRVEKTLLENIRQEFDTLLQQCENKEKEIAGYREYAAILTKELAALK